MSGSGVASIFPAVGGVFSSQDFHELNLRVKKNILKALRLPFSFLEMLDNFRFLSQKNSYINPKSRLLICLDVPSDFSRLKKRAQEFFLSSVIRGCITFQYYVTGVRIVCSDVLSDEEFRILGKNLEEGFKSSPAAPVPGFASLMRKAEFFAFVSGSNIQLQQVLCLDKDSENLVAHRRHWQRVVSEPGIRRALYLFDKESSRMQGAGISPFLRGALTQNLVTYALSHDRDE